MPNDELTEQFIVVNKDDRIIGYESRLHCHQNPGLIHRAVDVVIFNDKGQFLLQKRSSFKDTCPGMYGVSASGHVMKGETYRQAALREMKEEIGIKVKLAYKNKFLYTDKRESEIAHIYIGKHNGPFYIDKTEVEAVSFFKPAEIISLQKKLTPGSLCTLKILDII